MEVVYLDDLVTFTARKVQKIQLIQGIQDGDLSIFAITDADCGFLELNDSCGDVVGFKKDKEKVNVVIYDKDMENMETNSPFMTVEKAVSGGLVLRGVPVSREDLCDYITTLS